MGESLRRGERERERQREREGGDTTKTETKEKARQRPIVRGLVRKIRNLLPNSL